MQRCPQLLRMILIAFSWRYALVAEREWRPHRARPMPSNSLPKLIGHLTCFPHWSRALRDDLVSFPKFLTHTQRQVDSKYETLVRLCVSSIQLRRPSDDNQAVQSTLAYTLGELPKRCFLLSVHSMSSLIDPLSSINDRPCCASILRIFLHLININSIYVKGATAVLTSLFPKLKI
jgi:hypothetical protein